MAADGLALTGNSTAKPLPKPVLIFCQLDLKKNFSEMLI